MRRLFFICLLAMTGAAPETYHVNRTIPIGDKGKWDYAVVDPDTHLIYVTRQSHVQVIDPAAGKVVADIADTPGSHGVALAPKLNRGYVSDGQGNSVTVFDLKTSKALRTIPAGHNPDCILYEPSTNKVLTFNGKDKSVSVLDAGDENVKTAANAPKIPLDGKPEFAVDDDAGHVYVNLEDKSEIAVIDVKTWKVTQSFKIEGGEEPSGLAIDKEHHHLFAGCHNKVMAVVDTETGKTLATPPIGEGVDACGFDPSTGEAFASCGDGTLTVIKETSPGKFEVTQTVQTRSGARTMALDSATHTIYLPAAEMEAPAGGSGRPTAKPGTFMIVVVSH